MAAHRGKPFAGAPSKKSMRVPIFHLSFFVVSGIGTIVAIIPNAAVIGVTMDIVTIPKSFFKQFIVIRI